MADPRAILLALGVVSCSLVDSVRDYSGPPATGGTAGVTSDSGTSDAPADAPDAPPPCVKDAECDDDNPCTTDSCFAGLCRNDPSIQASCSDGNPCNGEETCATDGSCVPGAPPDKDDGNDCTVDTCDAVAGVVHQPISYPDLKACAGAACPAGYYVAAYLACDTECGGPNNCGFCINGALCRKLCVDSHVVCCGAPENCPTACPPGYSPTTTSCAAECSCGGCGPTVTCVRG